MYRDIRLYLNEKKWLIVLFLVLISFVLGYIGFYYSSPLDSHGTSPSPSDLAYLSLQLFVLTSGANIYQPHWTLDIARYLAPITTLITAILIVTIVFYRNFLYAYLRLFVRNHAIICGMGYVGPVIARNLRERDLPLGSFHRPKVVIIEKETQNPELEECRRLGAIIVEGDATREYFLKRANIRNARFLYCVTGEDDLNARIALTAKKMHETGTGDTLTCFLHIIDPRLTNLLKIGQMSVDPGSDVEFEFINIYQNAGKCLIDTLPFFRDTHAPPAHRVHLVIVDLGRMGEAMLIHAVKRWKESEFLEKTGEKIRISFIDRDAERKFSLLRIRYPSLEHYSKLIPLQMDMESPEFITGDYLLDDSHRCDATCIFVCSEDPAAGFTAALTLSDLLNRLKNKCPHVLGDFSTPVWISTPYEKGFAELFDELNRKSPEYGNLRIFPLVSCSCCIDLILDGASEQLARAIHGRYLENRYLAGERPGDRPALQPWSSLPEEVRGNNRRQAGSIFSSLKKEGFIIVLRTDWDEPVFQFDGKGPRTEIERLARLEHENWYRAGRKSGISSKEGQQHRCLRGWDDPELPEDCRERTREAVRTWPELLAMIDMKIIRQKEL